MTQKTEWQPIETAPEQQEVLVWCKHGVRIAAYLHGWWATVPGSYTAYPTHWQPLPESPEVSDAEN